MVPEEWHRGAALAFVTGKRRVTLSCTLSLGGRYGVLEGPHFGGVPL